MLARPEIQASLSRILIGDPSLPHLPKSSESFCPAEQASLSHSFRCNDPATSPPVAPSRRRCSPSIPTRWSIQAASFDSRLSGTIPFLDNFRTEPLENNTARQVTIRRQCHTSAQLADAKFKGSGFPRRNLLHPHCRASVRPVRLSTELRRTAG